MTLDELDLRKDQIRSLYLTHLQQMYSAEEMMFTATPTLAVAISMASVRKQLLKEAGQAPERMSLLESIFNELGEPSHGPICLPVKALIDQSTQVNMQQPLGIKRDLLLLSLAMEMKHLNIAKYLMGATFARALDFQHHAQALSNVQRDESEIDHQLRFIMQGIPPQPCTP